MTDEALGVLYEEAGPAEEDSRVTMLLTAVIGIVEPVLVDEGGSDKEDVVAGIAEFEDSVLNGGKPNPKEERSPDIATVVVLLGLDAEIGEVPGTVTEAVLV